jgi:hypothetical protein
MVRYRSQDVIAHVKRDVRYGLMDALARELPEGEQVIVDIEYRWVEVAECGIFPDGYSKTYLGTAAWETLADYEERRTYRTRNST